VNRYDDYITEFLIANKEVHLEKIGSLKLTTDDPDSSEGASVSFVYDRKIPTSPGLIDFITERSGKIRSLIESDLESHFTQVREFLNIGKSFEVLNAGLIKCNIRQEYEFIPYSHSGKAQKIRSQPSKAAGTRRRGGSGVQVLTFLIVLAIIGGLGWQAYVYYIKPKPASVPTTETDSSLTDSSASIPTTDSLAATTVAYGPNDSVDARYIFETTDLRLRAKTRTAQLISFGNKAAYDSFMNGNKRFYSLFIYKKTRIADTLAVKDSIQKFLQRNITVEIPPKQ